MMKRIKEYLQTIKYFVIDTWGWCNSLFIYYFRSIKKVGIFYGYCSYYWASKYAEKRTKNWKCKWDQSGKKQGVFPIADSKLITCSVLELKGLKKRKLINKNFKPRKAIKKSYYTTKY